MGRTRTKSKKSSSATGFAASSSSSSAEKSAPTVEALLAKAQQLLVQCEYPLAKRFVQRALSSDPLNPKAREMLALTCLENGELDEAKQVFASLVPPSPSAPEDVPYIAYLNLAQLSDEDPHLALRHYENALQILRVKLKRAGKARAGEDDDEDSLKNIVVRALIDMVEIWMNPSYDLCFEPEAEKKCEELLQAALNTDPGNAEALQTLASVRISQQRPEEARQCLEQAWQVWKDLDSDSPKMPLPSTRLAFAKLLVELELFEPTLSVLQGVLEADDADVEAWYVEGWALWLMAEKCKAGDINIDTGGAAEGQLDESTWEELARSARDCLDTCILLAAAQEHPDEPMLSHARELVQTLDELGIAGSQDDGDEEAEDDEWEDADSESGGEDVEMG